MRKITILVGLIVALALVGMSVQIAMGQQVAPTAEETMAAPVVEIPFLDDWMGSGHADATAEAFRHWDAADPAEVPVACAKCHSAPGYLDYLGADGTEAGIVDSPAVTTTVVSCVACHNEATLVKDSVVMPSGIELTGLGREARCMECHQGRESMVSVAAAIEAAAVADDDTTSDKIGFRNIHYFAAAATKYGTLAKGGFEYDGMPYDGNFAHVEGYDSCIGCHNSHTLEVKVEECATCHVDVAAVEDLRDVRMPGSLRDYDGDGDMEEGIAFELEGVAELLYGALQTYASDVLETPIAYDAHAYPYFFADVNDNGVVDEGDGRLAVWSPRLLKAAYNYQVYMKDPGAYAHGGKYDIQLMYDSITDLNAALGEAGVDLSAASRIDAGHFAGSQEAFRHWDADGAVPGSCAKCHSADGLPTFLAEGVSISQPVSNGFQCTTCHDDLQEWTRYEVTGVTFPSGATVDSGDANTNLCMNCHMGRESTVSVNRVISATEPDVVNEKLTFRNIHYFAAGATRFGTEAKGGYEYDGKRYVAYFDHARSMNQCVDCHGAHELQVDIEACADCHDDIEIASVEDLQNIRYNFADYDGNGDDKEGVYFEIDSLKSMLYEALRTYAAETVGTGIQYNPNAYPYFFMDVNNDGVMDADDARYVTWTPRLLRAAYNYQYASKDPGAFTHNAPYIIQLLMDSAEDLGVDVSGMTRP